MDDWAEDGTGEELAPTSRPGMPVLLSFTFVLIGLTLGMRRSLPLNGAGYLLSTFLALPLNARYWRLDIEARRDYRYRSSLGLKLLAGLSVGLALVSAGLNVWKIAFYVATR